MTTTYRERTFRERIAQSNVEAIQAELKRMRCTVANLIDASDALRASTVPIPTPGVMAVLEAAAWHETLADVDIAWLETARRAVREAAE